MAAGTTPFLGLFKSNDLMGLMGLAYGVRCVSFGSINWFDSFWLGGCD
jgi:hypothetical protein